MTTDKHRDDRHRVAAREWIDKHSVHLRAADHVRVDSLAALLARVESEAIAKARSGPGLRLLLSKAEQERDEARRQVAALRANLSFAVSGWRSGEQPDCGCEGCTGLAQILADTSAAAAAHDAKVRAEERKAVLAELNLPTWDPLLSATGDAGAWVKRQVDETRAEERERCVQAATSAIWKWHASILGQHRISVPIDEVAAAIRALAPSKSDDAR